MKIRTVLAVVPCIVLWFNWSTSAVAAGAGGGGLLVEFNSFANRYSDTYLLSRSAVVEERGEWGQGFFSRHGAATGGLGRLDPEKASMGMRYQGPPLFGGLSIIFSGGAVERKEGAAMYQRVDREGGFETRVEFAAVPGPLPAGRAAMVWYLEREDGPFDLTPQTRFAYRAEQLLPFNYKNRWAVAWLIVDRAGGCYVSNEYFELCRPVGYYRCQSGDPTALRWAKADFSGRDLFQSGLNFGGPQPALTGLRGAGIYAASEVATVESGQHTSVWATHRYFLVGEAEAVGRAVAAVPASAGVAKTVETVPLFRDGAPSLPRSPAAGGGPTPAKSGVGRATGPAPAAAKGTSTARATGVKTPPPRRPANGGRLAIIVAGYCLVAVGAAMLAFVAWSVWERLRRR